MESAKLLGHKEDQERFTEVLNKAKESYEIKLWNGKIGKNKISKNLLCKQQTPWPSVHPHILAKVLCCLG